MRIGAKPLSPTAACPACGVASSSVRKLASMILIAAPPQNCQPMDAVVVVSL